MPASPPLDPLPPPPASRAHQRRLERSSRRPQREFRAVLDDSRQRWKELSTRPAEVRASRAAERTAAPDRASPQADGAAPDVSQEPAPGESVPPEEGPSGSVELASQHAAPDRDPAGPGNEVSAAPVEGQALDHAAAAPAEASAIPAEGVVVPVGGVEAVHVPVAVAQRPAPDAPTGPGAPLPAERPRPARAATAPEQAPGPHPIARAVAEPPVQPLVLEPKGAAGVVRASDSAVGPGTGTPVEGDARPQQAAAVGSSAVGPGAEPAAAAAVGPVPVTRGAGPARSAAAVTPLASGGGRDRGGDDASAAAAAVAADSTEGQAEPRAPVGPGVRPVVPGAELDAPQRDASGGGGGLMPAPTEPREQAPPAMARALAVEQAVRLEQVTGMPVRPAAAASPHGDQSAWSPAPVSEAPLERGALPSNLLRGLNAVFNQRGGAMTMRLEPPELGALRIQMSLNGPVVSARFVATTPEAHTLLERNIAALRSALESHGMQVERLSVHLHQPSGGSGPGAGGDGGGASQQEGGGQRHDAAGGESRGRHSGRQQAHAGEGWDFGSHVERAAGAARGDQAP